MYSNNIAPDQQRADVLQTQNTCGAVKWVNMYGLFVFTGLSGITVTHHILKYEQVKYGRCQL